MKFIGFSTELCFDGTSDWFPVRVSAGQNVVINDDTVYAEEQCLP